MVFGLSIFFMRIVIFPDLILLTFTENERTFNLHSAVVKVLLPNAYLQEEYRLRYLGSYS